MKALLNSFHMNGPRLNFEVWSWVSGQHEQFGLLTQEEAAAFVIKQLNSMAKHDTLLYS